MGQNQNNEIRSHAIQNFISGLNDAEFIFLQHLLDFRKNLHDLKIKYNLSDLKLRERLNLSKEEYANYIKGAKNFDLIDIANVNALRMQLEIEKLTNSTNLNK